MACACLGPIFLHGRSSSFWRTVCKPDFGARYPRCRVSHSGTADQDTHFLFRLANDDNHRSSFLSFGHIKTNSERDFRFAHLRDGLRYSDRTCNRCFFSDTHAAPDRHIYNHSNSSPFPDRRFEFTCYARGADASGTTGHRGVVSYTDSDKDRYTYCYVYANSYNDADRLAHADPHAILESHCVAHSHPSPDVDVDPDADSASDINQHICTDRYPSTVRDLHTNSDASSQPDTNAHGEPNVHLVTDRNISSYAHLYGHADSHPDTRTEFHNDTNLNGDSTAYIYSYPHRNKHDFTDSNCSPFADSDIDTVAYALGDTYLHRNGYSNLNAIINIYCNLHTQSHANSLSDSQPNGHAYPDCHADTCPHGNPNARVYGYLDIFVHAHPICDANTQAHDNAYLYPAPDQDIHVHGNSHADRYSLADSISCHYSNVFINTRYTPPSPDSLAHPHTNPDFDNNIYLHAEPCSFGHVDTDVCAGHNLLHR